MKKVLTLLLCLAMALSVSACTKAPTEEEMASATYDVYNTIGSNVDELYLYEVGASDKGTNYAENILNNGDHITITTQAPVDETEDKVYVLEFKVVEGETEKFETLHFEVATIELLSIDEAAGASQIRFGN